MSQSKSSSSSAARNPRPDPLLPVYPRLDLKLASARGTTLTMQDGREIVDFYGGHAVTPLGHCHPALEKTICEGYRTLDFYSNSLHMDVQQRAARALLADSEHLTRVHFVNSGTEANEAALHLSRRLTERTRVLTFDCSFHGRSLASLQVTGLPGYQARLSLPSSSEIADTIAFGDIEALEKIDARVACVLCESIPSLAGIIMPPDDYYPALVERCHEVGALVVFDEVQGGVGRTGRWFAHQRFGVQPDIVTLAKSVAGGFPAGAMLTTEAIAERVTASELGTTFGGGPLACRMIEATAQTIIDENLMPRVEAIFSRIAAGVSALEDVTLRGAGCLMGLQTPLLAKELRDRLLSHDILVGVSAEPNTVRLLPPYVLSDQEIDRFVDVLTRIIEEHHR